MRRAAFPSILFATALVAATTLACDGFDSDSAPPPDAPSDAGADSAPVTGTPAKITMTVSPSDLRVARAGTTRITIEVTRVSAARAPIEVTLAGGLPDISAAPIRIDSSSNRGILDVTAGPEVAQGPVAGLRVEAAIDGNLEATAPLTAFVRGRPGEVDTTFGTGGKLEGVDTSTAAFDATGRFYVVKGGDAIVRYTTDGALDPTFVMAPLGLSKVVAIAVLQDKIFLCGDGPSAVFARLLPSGAVDSSYAAPTGIVSIAKPGGQLAGCFLSPAGNAALSWTTSGGEKRLTWIGAAGVERSFSLPGRTFRVGLLDAQRFTGVDLDTLARVRVEGIFDTDFGTGGMRTITPSYYGLLPYAPNPLSFYAFGVPKLRRHIASGAEDSAFASVDAPEGSSTTVATLQADGKIVAVYAGGSVSSSILRISPSGTVEPGFGGSGVIATPPDSAPTAVGVQPDGRVVVLGSPISRRFWSD